MCIAYRKLKKSTIKNKYPLPYIDDLFDQVIGEIMFSNIDLRTWYHQLRIKDEHIHKTTLKTRYGHYEFVILPFNLSNAPATFMCLMKIVLTMYFDEFILVFTYDILVYSKNQEEHEEHLKMVLQTLREHQLYENFSKCEFYKDKIQFLGHFILKEGLFVDL